MKKDDVEEYRTILNDYKSSLSESEPYKTCLENFEITKDITPAMKMKNDYLTTLSMIKIISQIKNLMYYPQSRRRRFCREYNNQQIFFCFFLCS